MPRRKHEDIKWSDVCFCRDCGRGLKLSHKEIRGQYNRKTGKQDVWSIEIKQCPKFKVIKHQGGNSHDRITCNQSEGFTSMSYTL